jgi:hypothetical protein
MQIGSHRSNIIPLTLIGAWALLCVGSFVWIALQ